MRRILRDGEATEFFGGLQGEYLHSKRAQLLEALASDAPLVELAARHKVHANLITKWKRQAGEGLVDIFSGKKLGRDASHEAEIKELHAKIGELTVERVFVESLRSLSHGRRVEVVDPKQGILRK